MTLTNYQKYAPMILRFGLGFVFIWFGYSGLVNPQMWVGLVPAWTAAIAPASTLVLIHGAIELIGGFLLFANWQVRWVSAILFLNLVHTITLLPYGPIMVRDIALAVALISVFARGDETITA